MVIYCEGEFIQCDEEENNFNEVGYDDIGGCCKQMVQICEMVELLFCYFQFFKLIGIKFLCGVFFFGFFGIGKIFMVCVVVNEMGVFFFLINGFEIMFKMVGEFEFNLRKVFEEVEKNLLVIIFIDEIDFIVFKCDKINGEVECCVVFQFLIFMDGMKVCFNVVVMVVINRFNFIDFVFCCFGCFDCEVDIGVFDLIGCFEIFQIYIKNMKFGDDVDFEQIVVEIYGYVGFDIVVFCFEVVMQQICEKMDFIDLDEDIIDVEVFDFFGVIMENFCFVFGVFNFFVFCEVVVVEVFNVCWEDIGGFEIVKEEFKESVQYFVDYFEKFFKFGMFLFCGVLFYGFFGMGKIMLVKVVVNECVVNFIFVKGFELFFMWFGEFESNICDIFDKVCVVVFCIVFFDELDFIVKVCGGFVGDVGGVFDCVVNQFFIGMFVMLFFVYDYIC